MDKIFGFPIIEVDMDVWCKCEEPNGRVGNVSKDGGAVICIKCGKPITMIVGRSLLENIGDNSTRDGEQ